MSRSRNTASPRARAIQRAPELPRIIVRRPRTGDTHPVPTQALQGALRSLPPAYLIGLKSIEMLPRPTEVGMPFASYREDDQRIFLYSLPMAWSWGNASEGIINGMKAYGACVSTENGLHRVSWESPKERCVWYVLQILSHELGHHYRYVNRYRRKQSRKIMPEEIGAHLHAYRIESGVWRERRKRSNQAL